MTDTIPKCLVPIHGRPLLGIWLEICDRIGIREVLINTHYLAEEVRAWERKQRSRVGVTLAYEHVLLGSAGTVAANRDFVRDDEDFCIFYADNLVHADLRALIAGHFRHDGVLSLGLFHSVTPEACGIVTLDETGVVTSFEEKPSCPKSDLANAGIFIARHAIFDDLPSAGFADFGKDVLPRLVGQMCGLLLDGYVLDVGTPANYQRAQQEWASVVAASAGCSPDSIQERRESPMRNGVGGA